MNRLLHLGVYLGLIGLGLVLGSWKSSRAPDAASRNSFESFARSIANRYQIEFFGATTGYLVDDKTGKALWTAGYYDRRKLNLEEARSYARSMISDFLNKIYTDPVFKNYIMFDKKTNAYSILVFSEEALGLKIGFWDENVDRPFSPYIAQIKVVNGKVHYYYADATTQALQEPPIVESLDRLLGDANPFAREGCRLN